MNIILYDNPSRFGEGTCWSPNVWKSRLLLNFKGVDYKTQWVHGPELAPTLESFGIAPHKPGTEMVEYTIPTVRLPDGTYRMESTKIARALEELYPSPSAHLDSDVLKEVMETMHPNVIRPLAPALVPRMPRECLSGTSIAYHREARKKTFGMTLEELEATRGGEGAWEKAQPGLEKIAEILNRDPSGPFCMGSTPSYADFIIVGFLEWCRCLQGDVLQRVYNIDPAFEKVYTGCQPFLERNGI